MFKFALGSLLALILMTSVVNAQWGFGVNIGPGYYGRYGAGYYGNNYRPNYGGYGYGYRPYNYGYRQYPYYTNGWHSSYYPYYNYYPSPRYGW